MATRTILVERAPLCPSCHQLPPNHDAKVDTPEVYNIPIPPYNEESGRRALNATEEMIRNCHNRNADSDDWTRSVAKEKLTGNWIVSFIEWCTKSLELHLIKKKTLRLDQQLALFERVERILDMDQLGRLALTGLSNEYLRRNAIIEKSVSRMRAALASVQWEPRLTIWLHSLLMTHLPSNYMVSYIDILQTLKHKIPALVDKMLYQKPIEMHKDYMGAILKKSWEPTTVTKTRTLPSNPVVVFISSAICSANLSSREKHWHELLCTLTSVEPVVITLQVNHHCSIHIYRSNKRFLFSLGGQFSQIHGTSYRTFGCNYLSQSARNSQSNAKSARNVGRFERWCSHCFAGSTCWASQFSYLLGIFV